MLLSLGFPKKEKTPQNEKQSKTKQKQKLESDFQTYTYILFDAFII